MCWYGYWPVPAALRGGTWQEEGGRCASPAPTARAQHCAARQHCGNSLKKNGSRGSSVWLSVAVLLPCLHVFTYMVCAAINRGLLIFSAAVAA